MTIQSDENSSAFSESPSLVNAIGADTERMRLWLRDEYRPWFDTALKWGAPRCRTEEERTLYPWLLAALAGWNAVIAFPRMAPGEIVALSVNLSRMKAGGPERRQWRVRCMEEASALVPAPNTLFLIREEALTRPWEAAARTVAALQSALMEEEPLSAVPDEPSPEPYP